MVDRSTVAALVRAGFEALEDNGLSGLTMQDVAQRLGVKAPAISWHLKSRRDLVDEMATEMWRQVHADVSARSVYLTPREGQVVLARAVRGHALARRDGARLLAGSYLTDETLLGEHQRLLVSGSVAEQQRVVRAYHPGLQLRDRLRDRGAGPAPGTRAACPRAAGRTPGDA